MSRVRKRQKVGWVGLVGCVLLVGMVLGRLSDDTERFVDSDAQATTVPPGLGQALPVPAAPEESGRVYQAAIGRGGSLYQSLVTAGLSPQSAQPIFDAFSEVLELKRLRSSDEVSVEIDSAGVAQRVEIVRGPAERYVATVADSVAHARRVEVAVEVRVARFQGTVDSSLYQTILDAGGSAELVARIADLFAWDIDFFTDPRPGDTFDVLVEERYLEGERISQGPILCASYAGDRASRSASRFVLADGTPGYFDENGKSLRKSLLKSPLNYSRISSTYSRRRLHPITKRYQPHLGVDFAAPLGTPIVAVGDGTVRFAAAKGANGKLVIIDHPSGYQTYYLHLSRFSRGVRRGTKVAQGQVIGYVGSTGRSTGPHLDFRVKKRGKFVNPLKLTLPPGPPVPAGEMAAYRASWESWVAVRAALPAGSGVVVHQPEDLTRLAITMTRMDVAAAGPMRSSLD